MLERVDGVIDVYTQSMTNPVSENRYLDYASKQSNQVNIQNKIYELEQVINAVGRAKKHNETDTIEYDGYRILPEDKEKIEEILNKYNIAPKEVKKEAEGGMHK